MFNFKGNVTVIGHTDKKKLKEFQSKLPHGVLVCLDSEITDNKSDFMLIDENHTMFYRLSISEIRRHAMVKDKATFVFTQLPHEINHRKAELTDFSPREIKNEAAYVFGFTETGGSILKNREGGKKDMIMEEMYFHLLFA